MSAARIFEEQCPVYMSYGMSYADYWDGDNELPKYYRELAKIQVKERDYQAWLTGCYVYSALTRVYPLFNALSNDKLEPYLELPFTYERELGQAKEHEAEKGVMEAWKALIVSTMKTDVIKRENTEGGEGHAGSGES